MEHVLQNQGNSFCHESQKLRRLLIMIYPFILQCSLKLKFTRLLCYSTLTFRPISLRDHLHDIYRMVVPLTNPYYYSRRNEGAEHEERYLLMSSLIMIHDSCLFRVIELEANVSIPATDKPFENAP